MAMSVEDITLEADAYSDDPQRMSDFIAGWYAGRRSSLRDKHLDELVKKSIEKVRPIIERERAGEHVTAETMDFIMR